MKNIALFKALSTSNVIYIDDDIGPDGVSAKSFKAELNKLKGPINVYINSAGGLVTDGISIYNSLQAYTGNITVHIEVLAASMASVIAMAGNEIIMPTNGLLMIHNPWGVTSGDARDHKKTSELLGTLKESMLDAYQAKTGIEREVLSEMMDEETWLTGETAKESGFITRVTNPIEIEAKNKALLRFSNLRKSETQQVARSHKTLIDNEAMKNILDLTKPNHKSDLFKSENSHKHTYNGIKNGSY